MKRNTKGVLPPTEYCEKRQWNGAASYLLVLKGYLKQYIVVRHLKIYRAEKLQTGSRKLNNEVYLLWNFLWQLMLVDLFLGEIQNVMLIS